MRLCTDVTDQRRRKHLQYLLDPLRQRPPLSRVEQHHLLLDPHAVGMDRGVPLRPQSVRPDPSISDRRDHGLLPTIRLRAGRRLGHMYKQDREFAEIGDFDANPRPAAIG